MKVKSLTQTIVAAVFFQAAFAHAADITVSAAASLKDAFQEMSKKGLNMKKYLLACAVAMMLQTAYAAPQNQAIYAQAAAAANKQDYASALKLLRPLANKGDATAQNNLAVMYEDGMGVKQDFKQALYWYQKAANNGLAEAQFNTGLFYAQGKGTKTDMVQAAKWYQLAAKQGHADAQNNLAARYATGQGVKRNLFQAKYWYGMAARNGHPTAAATLRELNKQEQLGNIK